VDRSYGRKCQFTLSFDIDLLGGVLEYNILTLYQGGFCHCIYMNEQALAFVRSPMYRITESLW